MNFLRIASRVLVTTSLILVLADSILHNGQPETTMVNAFDRLYNILTFAGLLFMGGFYGDIYE